MINTEINNFIDRILEMTQNGLIDWQPISSFFLDENISESTAASQLSIFCRNEFATLYEEDSFYFYNNKFQYLFLMHIAHESPKDGTITESWGLYAILDWDDDNFVSIPDYHPVNSEDRIKKISSLIKKNKTAIEEKRLLDFFNSII